MPRTSRLSFAPASYLTLQRHGVHFLVVGGFGAQLHGATRQTKDLDVRPAWGEENFDRLAAALEDLAARLRIPPEVGDVEVRANGKLLRETSVTHWRRRAGDVDVLQAISGRKAGRLPRASAARGWHLLVRFWLRQRHVECSGGLEHLHRCACVRMSLVELDGLREGAGA
jgi:hypothetical protein